MLEKHGKAGKAPLEGSIEERRKHVRLTRSVPVRVVDLDGEIELLSADVGGGGVRLFSKEPLKARHSVSMKIFLDDSKVPVVAKGTVVWERKAVSKDRYEVGVHLVNMGTDDRRRLVEFVRQNSG
ncbi:MAG: PilZ domain-containing protein [Armatimonadetes bacterium]|nr:PilZ domain-containing protein [Armatimonadota bacterium]